MPRSGSNKGLTFNTALKSFTGFLEGTGKSIHTIRNYQSDLTSFREFLKVGLGAENADLTSLRLSDLEKFHEHLKSEGFKTNTRRRKVLTVRRLFRFLSSRKKIKEEFGQKVPAPHKVERIPAFMAWHPFISKIRNLPGMEAGDLFARNRALLATLAETGCLVSEVGQLRFSSWKLSKGEASVRLGESEERWIKVSPELYQWIQELPGSEDSKRLIFMSFNKFGSRGAPISSRGVELLVKSYAERLGLVSLTPRVFRHTAVKHWIEEGVQWEEIQRRLGLKSDYSYRMYEPWLRSKNERSRNKSV